MLSKIKDLRHFTNTYLVNFADGEHKQTIALCDSESEAKAVVEYFKKIDTDRDKTKEFYYYNKLLISDKLIANLNLE